ncbi:MAG: helix-turn-helix domain-containing protein [Acidobacteriota bacterium]
MNVLRPVTLLENDNRQAAVQAHDARGLHIECPCCKAPLQLESVSLRANEPQATELGKRIHLSCTGTSLEKATDEIRRQLIGRALWEANGIKSRAANLLGLKYSTFWENAQRLQANEPKMLEDFAIPADGTRLDEVEIIVVRCADAAGRWEVRVDAAGRGQLLQRVVSYAKRSIAQRALARTAGNAARAARLLEMNYSTYYALLRRFRLVAADSDTD